MPFINFPAREINCKLVYYGPGLGGKTANLQWVYDHTGASQKGKMVSLATETDRTLFFDFLPLDLGTVRGFRTRFHLYTVPGQVFYEASRRLILKGADGVVFVARTPRKSDWMRTPRLSTTPPGAPERSATKTSQRFLTKSYSSTSATCQMCCRLKNSRNNYR